MKTIPIITFFLCTVMYAHAQLNIVPKNDGLKEYTVTNAHPYDSLTNVEKRSFTSLPGQTLYMHGVKNDRNGYWDAFYTVNFLTGDDRTVYKASKKGGHGWRVPCRVAEPCHIRGNQRRQTKICRMYMG